MQTVRARVKFECFFRFFFACFDRPGLSTMKARQETEAVPGYYNVVPQGPNEHRRAGATSWSCT